MNLYARDVILSPSCYQKDILSFHKNKELKDKLVDLFNNLNDKNNIGLPLISIFNLQNSDKMLVLKFAKLFDEKGELKGILAIIYDITSVSFVQYKSQPHLSKLPVLEGNKVMLVDIEEIVYIKAIGNATNVTCQDNKEYLSTFKISELESRLKDYGFFRSHKSYIINLSYLKEIIPSKNSFKLYLQAKSSFFVPLSRRSKSKLNHILYG